MVEENEMAVLRLEENVGTDDEAKELEDRQAVAAAAELECDADNTEADSASVEKLDARASS